MKVNVIDDRTAPGSEQPRMGKTCPEMLDEARTLVDHWRALWELADKEVGRLNEILEEHEIVDLECPYNE